MKTMPLEEAAAMIPDGASVMIGGFMGVGTPGRIIDALVARGTGDLTVIANDTAIPGAGIGKLVRAGLVRRAVVSHVALDPETEQQMLAGKMEVDLVPRGTLVERIRAGGHGLGGILTTEGIRTAAEMGKPRLVLDGRTFLVEPALRAEFALVSALLADYVGNLEHALTARSFNPLITAAADVVIVEADGIVPIGVIAPDHVVTPAPLVDYVVAH